MKTTMRKGGLNKTEMKKLAEKVIQKEMKKKGGDLFNTTPPTFMDKLTNAVNSAKDAVNSAKEKAEGLVNSAEGLVNSAKEQLVKQGGKVKKTLKKELKKKR